MKEPHSSGDDLPVHLLDANVLIALTLREHEHHDRAALWLASVGDYAVCPIVEGELVRFLLRLGEPAAAATAVLATIASQDRSRHWADDVPFSAVDLSGVRGYRQVTDTYLVALARAHGGLLATFDQGLVHAHPRLVVPIP
ncbi:TA system VapC family ribonuclease toxin [Ornithinimicrobium sp. Y1847]|uniref:TA system VapC family ribonuclease toxin n=1 Tax=unclassified Ornithinimicrobium TaxID=2615080 RepID=UPI003B670ADF